MRDPMTERVTLGAFDGGRAVADYDLLRTCFENVPAMQPETAFTNRFLDTALRMPPA